MKLIKSLMLVACLALPLAACKKEEEAPKETVQAPLTAPTTDDRQAWIAYLQDVVGRNMGGISNQPYVYMVPAESLPDFQDQYDRLLEKAETDVARGIISGNMLAYGGHASAKVADLIVESFKDVEPNSMKGVRVVFIGNASENDRVKTVVEPTGVEYVFVEAK